MFNFYLKQKGTLSLKEAAEIYGYTQHHFGLLCRQGKLKSERIGKRWFTTQKWAGEYLDGLKEQYKTNNHNYPQLKNRFILFKRIFASRLHA